ncbi:MAG: RluA family pseudouridine synthase, partial [Proteobacteria bacterium]|nr:RluA family pseudouridine synthase [Pseudomonadota bacterium]MBU1611084.1 RluA family pseudouridine synthase [Pseudomonadota bacterium]
LEPALDANSSPGTTFVRAIIARGARHQIRAHLAAAGHPIVGDALYGTAGERLCLYHTALDFPGFSVRLDPDR